MGAADEGGGDAGALPPQVLRRARGGEGPVRQEQRQRAVQGVLLLRRRRRPGSAAGAQALQLRPLDGWRRAHARTSVCVCVLGLLVERIICVVLDSSYRHEKV